MPSFAAEMSGKNAWEALSTTTVLTPQESSALAVRGNDQDAAAAQGGDPRRLGYRSRLFFQVQGEPEGGSLPRFALQADFPPHELHKLFRDGRAQARAAVTPRDRLVRLGEPLADGAPR